MEIYEKDLELGIEQYEKMNDLPSEDDEEEDDEDE